MKKNFVTLAFIIFATISVAQAQPQMRFRGSDGWGPNTRYEQAFDNFNLRTFVATVVRVDTITPIRDEMSVAMRLIAQIDGEEVAIHLGPMWYVTHQDINFPRGERIDVRGHRTSLTGVGEFIMPVEIRSRNRIFRFRDDDGHAFWTVIRPR